MLVLLVMMFVELRTGIKSAGVTPLTPARIWMEEDVSYHTVESGGGMGYEVKSFDGDIERLFRLQNCD